MNRQNLPKIMEWLLVTLSETDSKLLYFSLSIFAQNCMIFEMVLIIPNFTSKQ